MRKKHILLGGIVLGKKRKKHRGEKASDIKVDTNVDESGEKKDFIHEFERVLKNKYFKYSLVAVLIILAMVLAVYVRLGPLNLPVTDDWARDTFEQNYKSAIEQEIRAQRPNLPDSSIERMVEEEYANFYAENQAQIDAQIESTSSTFRSYLQNDEGMTYLLGIDEYMFYSYAKWHQKTGFFGSDIVDGEKRFMLRDGRFGMPANFRLHPFMISTLYDVWSPFNSDFNIEWAAWYIQVVLIALSAIPLFFLSKKIGGTTGGFIATVLVLTAVPLVGRTLGGSSDDDVHTIMYTFIMMALFVYSLGKRTWLVAGFAALAGLTNAIFMFGWSGWWYGFLLVLGSAGAYLIYEFIRSRFIEKKSFSLNHWINAGTFLVVFFVSAIIFAMIFSPLSNNSALEQAGRVVSAPGEPLRLVARLGAGADISTGAGEYPLWPNVLRTVAELNPARFDQIIEGAGALPFGGGAGILFFYISLIGIGALFFRYKENVYYPLFGFILLVWMAGMIFVAMDAIRFILMASIPILIGVGAFIGFVLGPVAKYVVKNTKVSEVLLVSTVSVLLAVWFLFGAVGDARAASEGAIPIFDDAWYESVDAIRLDAEQYDERGIISSWWDYGHFFQAYGNQSVTFDGGHQGKRIYWMGRSLLTDDPVEAHNILKVMNCGQEKPYDLLEDHFGERYRPTRIKLDIAQLNRDDARAYLENEDLPDDLIEEVLGLTHCDDLRPMYFVTSEDMVGKAPVWSHFGGWNFTKAYFYYRLRHLPLDEVYDLADDRLNLSEDEARDLYNTAVSFGRNEDAATQWISPFSSYATRQKSSCSEDNDVVTCNYNIALQETANSVLVLRRAVVPLDNLEDSEFVIQEVARATNTPMGQDAVKPVNVVVEQNGTLRSHEFNDASLGLDLVVMEEDNGFSAILTDPALSKSVFNRLFFMEGRGSDLDMFEKISDTTSFRGERIIVWKVHP